MSEAKTAESAGATPGTTVAAGTVEASAAYVRSFPIKDTCEDCVRRDHRGRFIVAEYASVLEFGVWFVPLIMSVLGCLIAMGISMVPASHDLLTALVVVTFIAIPVILAAMLGSIFVTAFFIGRALYVFLDRNGREHIHMDRAPRVISPNVVYVANERVYNAIAAWRARGEEPNPRLDERDFLVRGGTYLKLRVGGWFRTCAVVGNRFPKWGRVRSWNGITDITLVQGNGECAFRLYNPSITVLMDLVESGGLQIMLQKVGAAQRGVDTSTSASHLFSGVRATIAWLKDSKDRVARSKVAAEARDRLERIVAGLPEQHGLPFDADAEAALADTRTAVAERDARAKFEASARVAAAPPASSEPVAPAPEATPSAAATPDA